MKRLIALTKAWRGGEWFRASLESVWPHTDGTVAVIGDGSWIGPQSVDENCSGPLEEFAKLHPTYPVHRFYAPPGVNSADQYNVGLKAIKRLYGPDAAVLIVDTDEVWPEESLLALRKAIEDNPEIELFQGRLWAYVKSPLYQVWPPEPGTPCVALQSPILGERLERWSRLHNRFASPPMTNMIVAGAWFHHFTYVRETEEDLRLKFNTTASQERYPSNPDWWDTVWPLLPNATNFHMTQGCEHCWPGMRVITPAQLPGSVRDLPLVRKRIEDEEAQWRKRVLATDFTEALIPSPTDHDATKYYRDLDLPLPLEWCQLHFKTTYLEALWLAYWARSVPNNGRILEIGCGDGGSTAVLACASDESVQLDTVDPFKPYTEEGTSGAVEGINEGNFETFLQTARQFGYSRRLLHQAVSSMDADGLLMGQYDLAFVDGNHSTAYVLNDLKLAWRKLKPGGLLIGHDYTTRFPGVLKGVEEWGIPISVPVGTSLFYVRKEAC